MGRVHTRGIADTGVHERALPTPLAWAPATEGSTHFSPSSVPSHLKNKYKGKTF